jgi:hypothetical protein
VYGKTSTGYGGFFEGKVYTAKWYELTEISTPPSPVANRARLFLKDNGSGKTQLCVKFANGTVKVLATEGDLDADGSAEMASKVATGSHRCCPTLRRYR